MKYNLPPILVDDVVTRNGNNTRRYRDWFSWLKKQCKNQKKENEKKMQTSNIIYKNFTIGAFFFLGIVKLNDFDLLKWTNGFIYLFMVSWIRIKFDFKISLCF